MILKTNNYFAKNKSAGFTLLEIFLTVSIFFILIAVTVPIINQEWFNEENISSHYDIIVSALREARLKSIYAENDLSYGLWLNVDAGYLSEAVFYSGASYGGRVDSRSLDISSNLEIVLSNGTMPLDINFEKFSGASINQEIIIDQVGSRKKYHIYINESGNISKSAKNK